MIYLSKHEHICDVLHVSTTLICDAFFVPTFFLKQTSPINIEGDEAHLGHAADQAVPVENLQFPPPGRRNTVGAS